MAKYFEGTSTKERYQVGQAYNTAHGIVVAQSDGSFRDISSGAVSQGSAGNPDVRWYATGSDAVGEAPLYTDQGKRIETRGYTSAAPVAAAAATGAKAAPAEGFSPGGAVPISTPATVGNRGAFIRDWAFSGKDDPIQDAIFAGVHWYANPKNSNLDWIETRYGDSEIVQEFMGLAGVGSDIGFNAARMVFGPRVQEMGPMERYTALQGMAAVGAGNLGTAITEGAFGAVGAARAWAADNAANEAAIAAERAAVEDAWDYRQLLQHQEANAHKGRQIEEKWRLEEVRQDAIARGPAALAW